MRQDGPTRALVVAVRDLEQRRERRLKPEVVEHRDDVEPCFVGSQPQRGVRAGRLVRLQREPELAGGPHVRSPVRHRPARDALDPHDHPLVRIGAGDQRVLLEPVRGRQAPLLGGQQRQDALQRVEAEMAAGRDAEAARLRQLEVVADREAADRSPLDPLDGHAEVVERHLLGRLHAADSTGRIRRRGIAPAPGWRRLPVCRARPGDWSS